jgi:hypothetical protein
MPDIISDPVVVTKRVKTRACQIYISNPYAADKRLDFTSEARILLDDANGGVEPQSPPAVTRMVSQVAAKTVTITDPVTGQAVTVSVAGIATAIEQCYVDWFNDDRAAEAAAKAAEEAAAAARAAAAAARAAEDAAAAAG